MRKIQNNIFSIDPLITIIFLILVFIGFISIFSTQIQDDVVFFSFNNEAFKQLIWIIFSFVILISVFFLEHRFIYNLAVPLYIFSILLLIAVFFVGVEVSGSKSWFSVFGFRFQPSEFSKFSTALLLAKIFDSYNLNLKSLKNLMYVSIVIVLPSLLILIQGDFGTALVFSSFFLVFFREGMSLYLVLFIVGVVVIFLLGLIFDPNTLYIVFSVCFLIAIGLSKKNPRNFVNLFVIYVFTMIVINGQGVILNDVLKPYQKNRIESLINPGADPLGAGWNITQSKIAIGSGGFFGKGFLNGTQTRLDFVPEQSTDFIFSVVGEEFGFVGSLFLIFLYSLLLIRIVQLAENQKDIFARVFGYSIFSVLTFHYMINIAMTLGMFPVIGIPLPFISYGGSSLLSFCLLLFVFMKLNSVQASLLSR